MRRILLIKLILFTLLGCGVSQSFTESCGGDLDAVCDALFGHDRQAEEDAQDEAIGALEEQVRALEAQISALIASTEANFASTQLLLSFLQTQTSMNQAQIVDLEDYIEALNELAEAQQVQIENMIARLAELELREQMAEVLDPCGDGPGFDEVLIRTSSGRLIAYFEQGSRRFLSILGPGSYATTDATSCNFSVDAQLRLCDNLGCR